MNRFHLLRQFLLNTRRTRAGLVCAAGLLSASILAGAPFPVELLVEEARLTNNVNEFSHEYDSFGTRVALHGNLAAVGAEGAVNLFERHDNAWVHQGDIHPVLPRNTGFPNGIDLEGTTLVAGNRGFGDGGTIFVYEKSQEPGLNAWNISDHTSSTAAMSYSVDVPPETDGLARTNGWRFHTKTRFLGDDLGTFAMIFIYGDGETRYGYYLDFNQTGEFVVGLLGASPVEFVLSDDPAVYNAYHDHELVFDPNTQMATYSFDGNPIHTWAGQNQINNGIFFGSGSTGGRGAMNVHQVEFEIFDTGEVLASYDAGTSDTVGTPADPVTQGWTQVGAPSQNVSVGPVAHDLATRWVLKQVIPNPHPNDTYGLGTELVLNGDTLVSSTSFGSEAGGVAEVFVRENGVWAHQTSLYPSSLVSGETFGTSASVDQNVICIGAQSSPFSSAAGRAFVYRRQGTNWIEEAILQAVDRAGGDGFGSAVGVSGDRIAVGARWDDHGSHNYAGSVYIFEYTGTAWLEKDKVFAEYQDEGFGSTLALEADTLVVGGFYYGDHWLFSWNGSEWQQVQVRSYPDTIDPALHDVGIDGDRFIVGVSGTEGESGAVYIYSTDFNNPAGVAAYVGKQLYYDQAQSSGTFDPNRTVFRYKKLLYKEDEGGLRARHEMMSDFYGPEERQQADILRDTLLQGLAYAPNDHGLGELLLELAYDRSAAETIIAKNRLEDVEKARFADTNALSGAFVIDTEIPLLFDLLETNRFAMQPYFDLLKLELLVMEQIEAQTRWATEVIDFSSQYSDTGWSAAQALGEPDTYPNYGDIGTAWASDSSDDQAEFLALGYDNPARVLAIRIYETLAPGAVNQVSLRDAASGQWHVVWSGTAFTAPPESRIFEVTIPPTTFEVDGVRIDLDSPAVPSWNEIDAIALVDVGSTMTELDDQFGHRLFQSRVPGRGLMAATYKDDTGSDVPVVPNTMLFDGYKDLVLLFNLLGDQGHYAVQLGQLLLARDEPGDRAQAEALIGDSEKFLWLHGQMLLGIFPGLELEDDDPSGLAQAVRRWERSLTELATLQQSLTGRANVLGFDRDFLMFVQKFTGQSGDLFDSYDAFKIRLDPSGGSNPLRTAVTRLNQARASYDSYRGYEDQLAGQLVGSSITYEDRLRDIVGVFPDDPTYSDGPTTHPGSELDQQYRSIEVARLRILKNKIEISNLRRQVQIEMNKAADISSTIIDYGNRQARLTQKIGDINAAQAAANQLTDYLNPANLVSGASIAIALNFGVQTVSELEKARLEAEKERLAAMERATIVGIESAAVVKTLLLSMNTLAVDSMEAALLLTQEANRLAALYREKAQLEQELAERSASLAQRYYADPVHRLRSQADMVAANLSFANAQKWLFFVARALEYKWNNPMTDYDFEGREWSTDSVFKLRNADELTQFYLAMDDFESQLQLPKDDYFDWFSVRDDFFGYALTDSLGQTNLYEDPITGELVNGIQAFRSRLHQLEDNGNIQLEFSTVREIPGSTFFRGPRFDSNGQAISKGLFLDKIRWIKINLPGSHTLTRTTLAGVLEYGGTSFMRNFNVGTYDPDRPDRLRGEMSAYSTRFWFFDPSVNQWKFNNALASTVTMQLSQDSRVPPTVQELEVFKERSVAASGWVLTIPTTDLGQTVLDIDKLDDVEIYFYHYAVTRP